MRGYPDFLAGFETVRIAGTMLAGRHFFAENNFSVRHFNPAQHVVHALNENPAFDHWFIRRRISDFAAKRSIRSRRPWNGQQGPDGKKHHPAEQPHVYSDAELWSGVALSRNTPAQGA